MEELKKNNLWPEPEYDLTDSDNSLPPSKRLRKETSSFPPPPLKAESSCSDPGPPIPNKGSEPLPDESFDPPDYPSLDTGSKTLSSEKAKKELHRKVSRQERRRSEREKCKFKGT